MIINLHAIYTLCANCQHMPVILLILNVFRYTSSGVSEVQGEKGGRDAVQTRCA
jgi:hypothetical protein